ncbi:hypothetical protein QRD02_04665 [Aequorivita sp. SDUM287046]|uniref:Uncharacterized protein n=1 Tax=Aequorivita aurantiaca TaxID=3053356 RepID=A0ABT8DER7_9FLAO|nr:hypothetical protein [Aequorivita aurantiaca]MDN3723663.1 hypothetical protein [Aequorivita aurantiaca]
MKKYILVSFIFISFMGFAQNDETFVDALVNQKLAELEMQQHPEYFLRKNYCEGNVQMFVMPNGKHCASKGTYYSVFVFWKEGEDVMKVQKFDNCGKFAPIPIAMGKNIKKILKDKETLKTEEVKPFKSEKVDENAFDNMSVTSCHTAYKFVLAQEVIEKWFSEFDLTNSSKNKNVNADHNKSLLIIKLDKDLSEMIKHFEETGTFVRQN